MKPPLTVKALLLILASFAYSIAAADDIEPLSNSLNTPSSAAAGVAIRLTTSPYLGARVIYDLLPIYKYEGDRLFLNTNRVGIKLFEEKAAVESQRVDFFMEQRLEGFPFENTPDSLAGMAARQSGFNVGLALRVRQSWGTLRAEVMKDVGGASRGTEARLGYSTEWRSGPWSLRPDVSVSFRDARLNNYYYGVLPNEAQTGRAAYAPGAGLQGHLGLFGTYDLTQRWRLLAGVSATVLGSSVKNSPIVQKKVLPSAYLGAAYDFGSPKGSRDTSQGGGGTPTYVKLLYGKATEDGCHLARIITARCLSTAKVDATSIAGIQVGKPFIEKLNGWPLDIAGYVGVTRHNERGLQANGLQLDVFMKGFYYGFPWSERFKTRLGLGMGLSAAQRVPYAEVISKKDEPTSRLLQYLDPTIDVSVGDLVGVRSLKNTFIGIGVSHRSGVFSASRLLGNANGGSNYIYTYVESAF